MALSVKSQMYQLEFNNTAVVNHDHTTIYCLKQERTS